MQLTNLKLEKEHVISCSGIPCFRVIPISNELSDLELDLLLSEMVFAANTRTTLINILKQVVETSTVTGKMLGMLTNLLDKIATTGLEASKLLTVI